MIFSSPHPRVKGLVPEMRRSAEYSEGEGAGHEVPCMCMQKLKVIKKKATIPKNIEIVAIRLTREPHRG